jgi:hypothetical protein
MITLSLCDHVKREAKVWKKSRTSVISQLNREKFSSMERRIERNDETQTVELEINH